MQKNRTWATLVRDVWCFICWTQAQSDCEQLLIIDTACLVPARFGLRVKMCVWLGVSRGLDLAFLNAD